MMHRRPVGIVILAAGGSRRMGRPKQLLPFGGRTLLRRAVETAITSVCRPIIVTIGAHDDLVKPELQSLPVVVAHNPEWAQGMSSSLRVGIAALARATNGDVEGAVITLADQPFVTASDVNRIVDVHWQTGKDIVASDYADTEGVPIFISERLFEDVEALTGNGGAKRLIALHREQVATVPLRSAAFDIDTPTDFEKLSRV